MMANLESFEDSVHAYVCGASRGIGLGLVRALLDSDAVECVYASSRYPEKSDALSELREEHPDRLRLFSVDVTVESDIADAAEKIGNITDELHLLFNCVGVLHDDDLSPEKSLRDLTAENFAKSFAVNATGHALVARYFHGLFRHGKHAVFANLSAHAGSIGDNSRGGWYSYRAAKAAQNQVTKSFSIEMQRKAEETVVVALHPGTVDTHLSEPFKESLPEDEVFSVDEAVANLLAVIDDVTPDDTGSFFDHDGSKIEW